MKKQKYEKNKLGLNGHLEDSLSEKLFNLNESVNHIVQMMSPRIIDVVFIFRGSVEDGDLNLVVRVYFDDGVRIVKHFNSHVDISAIELIKNGSKHFYNLNEDDEIEINNLIDENGGSLKGEFLRTNEPELFEQLAKEYLLFCSPNVNDGAEFTESDREFFNNIVEEYKTKYIA